jgi:hypothetical protein
MELPLLPACTPVLLCALFVLALPRLLPLAVCDLLLPRSPRTFARRYPRGWALVTGASSGLGLAACEALADAGFDIVMTGRRAEVLEHHARRLCARGRAGNTVRSHSFFLFFFGMFDLIDLVLLHCGANSFSAAPGWESCSAQMDVPNTRPTWCECMYFCFLLI